MRFLRINLIIIGIALGSVLGLLSGWVFYPKGHAKASPATLRADYQELYMLMVAAAYRADHDLERASARLATLRLDNPVAAITELAQRAALQKRNEFTVTTARELALALGGEHTMETLPEQVMTGGMPTTTPSETATTEPTITPLPKVINLPTPNPTQTPVYDYVLLDQEQVCDANLTAPLIQVQVIDVNGQPLPGVQVVITWTDGQDRFSSGLKPEISPGYGDFTMIPGIMYSVQIGSRTLPLQGVISQTCVSGDVSYPGSVLVRWQREG